MTSVPVNTFCAISSASEIAGASVAFLVTLDASDRPIRVRAINDCSIEAAVTAVALVNPGAAGIWIEESVLFGLGKSVSTALEPRKELSLSLPGVKL